MMKVNETMKIEAIEKDRVHQALMIEVNQRFVDSTQAAAHGQRDYVMLLDSAQGADDKLRQASDYIAKLQEMIAALHQQQTSVNNECHQLKAELESQKQFHNTEREAWEKWHCGNIGELNKAVAKANADNALTSEVNVTLYKAVQELKVTVVNLTKEKQEASGSTAAASHDARQHAMHDLEADNKLLREELDKAKQNPAQANLDEVIAHLNTAFTKQMLEMKAKKDNLKQLLAGKENDFSIIEEELKEANKRLKLCKCAQGGSANVTPPVGAGGNPAAASAKGTAGPTSQLPKAARNLIDRIQEFDSDSGHDTEDDASQFHDATSIAQVSEAGTASARIPGSRRATTIDIPKFPSFNSIVQWVSRIGRNCWSVSQYADRNEIAWINEVWDKSYEELADSGETRYAFMDPLIVMKLEKMLPADLEREYQNMCAKAS